MSEEVVKDMNEQRGSVAYQSFNALFRAMEEQFPSLTPNQFMTAVSQTGMYSMFTLNPMVQNRRVKGYSSIPHAYGKNDIADMLLDPNNSEKGLREVSDALVYTAYPYFKLIKTAADILTYRHYSYPSFLDESDAKTKEFTREWRLVDKISNVIKPKQTAHEIAGICLREGKAFYLLRSSVDKSHNAVNYAFLQQLPQDWTKIVGFNNVTKYTVAFNMMYFFQYGTDVRQFGDTFLPYWNDFMNVMKSKPRRGKKREPKPVYSAYTDYFDILSRADTVMEESNGDTEIYYQDGKWFYWVTLPAESVWTFEIDDTSRNVISPYAGLIMSMAQIAQYENLQLELLSNPLVSILHGEIEYQDNTTAQMEDAYKLSPSGRAFFEALWYQMLNANNTAGIGFYAAPLKNMKLEQLAEAPNATEISVNGYSYVMMKSGNGLLPLSDEPRAGMVQYSALIESQFAKPIYGTFENLMNWLYDSIGLKYEWRFRMFGNIFTEKEELESARKGMTLGVLIDTLRYDALLGHSILEDIGISNAISESGVLDKRIPLVSSYSMKQDENGGLPPQSKGAKLPPEAQVDEGGRPSAEGVTSEGQESSLDAGE